MDIESHSHDLTTPLSFKNIYKTEDSGYHTTFTSPSIEFSTLSNNTPDPSTSLSTNCKLHLDCSIISPCTSVKPSDGLSKRTYHQYVNFENPLKEKRSLKRSYDGGLVQTVTGVNASTPTSIIAREVQKLKVNDSKYTGISDPGHNSHKKDVLYAPTISYPATPKKKVCRDGCNLSPFTNRRSSRKVDFSIHSLSCEKKVLEPQTKHDTPIGSKLPKLLYKPNQKLDIISMLYNHENYFSSSIGKILSYLSQEDIYNFTLVSRKWCDIFKSINTKQKCSAFFDTVKSNLENWEQVKLKASSERQIKPLRETQNLQVKITPCSPERSPRTTRFRKFTKAASLDERNQLSCSKCQHPAKVTVEPSGEEWVQCISTTCAYQFCRLCRCARHPGKVCVRYDLIDGPSPSKRKKNVCPVSSNKSKKNLKRLLFRDTT